MAHQCLGRASPPSSAVLFYILPILGYVTHFRHSLTAQQLPKAVIPPKELIGLITWINLCRTVVDLVGVLVLFRPPEMIY